MKVFASVLALLFAYNVSLACSCVNTSEAQRIENLKKIQIVFQGEVLSVSEPYTVKLKNSKGKIYGEEQYVDVNFKVNRAWKGVDNSQVTIRTFTKLNSCSIQFQVGVKPTVLANGTPPRTDYCTAGIIEYNKIPEILGEGKVFDQSQAPPIQQTENSESFFAGIWNQIASLFS